MANPCDTEPSYKTKYVCQFPVNQKLISRGNAKKFENVDSKSEDVAAKPQKVHSRNRYICSKLRKRDYRLQQRKPVLSSNLYGKYMVPEEQLKYNGDSRSISSILRRLGPTSNTEKCDALLHKCAELYVDMENCANAIQLDKKKLQTLKLKNLRLQAKVGSGQVCDDTATSLHNLGMQNIYEKADFYEEYAKYTLEKCFPDEFPSTSTETPRAKLNCTPKSPAKNKVISKPNAISQSKFNMTPLMEREMQMHKEKRVEWKKERDYLTKELETTVENCDKLQEVLDYLQHVDKTASTSIFRYSQTIKSYDIVKKEVSRKLQERLLYRFALDNELNALTNKSNNKTSVETQTSEIDLHDVKVTQLEAELEKSKEVFKNAMEESKVPKCHCKLLAKFVNAHGQLKEPSADSVSKNLLLDVDSGVKMEQSNLLSVSEAESNLGNCNNEEEIRQTPTNHQSEE